MELTEQWYTSSIEDPLNTEVAPHETIVGTANKEMRKIFKRLEDLKLESERRRPPSRWFETTDIAHEYFYTRTLFWSMIFQEFPQTRDFRHVVALREGWVVVTFPFPVTINELRKYRKKTNKKWADAQFMRRVTLDDIRNRFNITN